MLSIVALLAVFILISIRQVGGLRLQIWQIMSGGALFVLLTGQISPGNALRAVNWDVIIFLFGMFSAGALFEISGYLSYNQYLLFKRTKNSEQMLFILVFFTGMCSSVLMNDTMAIVGTPVVIHLAKRYGLSAKPLLLALAFSVTIGSVMSPIGNPQNLLIALNGNFPNPFLSFMKSLFVPTFLNLLLLFFAIKFFYGKDFTREPVRHFYIPEKRPWLFFLSRLTLVLILLGVAAKIYFSLNRQEFRLTWIALLACLPALFLSFNQLKILKAVDWKTLIFFIAMFVLMRAVWDSVFFQDLAAGYGLNTLSIGFIFAAGLLLSQFISNVPLVALLMPVMALKGADERHFLALAAASTLAGNISLLGAASNVIIVQNAEDRAGETLTFWEFFRIGFPLTVLNCFIYALFLR